MVQLGITYLSIYYGINNFLKIYWKIAMLMTQNQELKKSSKEKNFWFRLKKMGTNDGKLQKKRKISKVKY